MKKLICIILSICLSLCNYVAVFAYQKNDAFEKYNVNDFTVFDEFHTDNYSIIGLEKNDSIFYVTIQNDGKIELVTTNKESPIYSIWLTVDDINYNKNNKNLTINRDLSKNIYSIIDVVEYGLKNITNKHIVKNVSGGEPDTETNIYEDIPPVDQLGVRHLDIDEYNSLMNQLEIKHGTEHYGYNWHAQEVYSEKTISYKENLDYEMVYRDSAVFEAGVTLAEVAAQIFKLTGIKALISLLATVIGVGSAANTIINRNGSVSAYFGSATYFRYVYVNNRGPFYEGYKISEYVGYVEPGRYNYARLQEKSTIYSGTTEVIFNDYQRQRTIALNNYY